MDARDGSWADVVDQMAEHNTIDECSPQVFMQTDLQSHFNALVGRSEGSQLRGRSQLRGNRL